MPGPDAEPKSVAIWASLIDIHHYDDDDDGDDVQETLAKLYNRSALLPDQMTRTEGSLPFQM